MIEFPRAPHRSARVIGRRLVRIVGAVALTTMALLIIPAPLLDSARYSAWAAAVQAVGTVLAFAITASALVWQWAAARDARDERDLLLFEQADEERRDQAILVSCWMVVLRSDSGEWTRMVVRNGSDLPVTKVVTSMVDGGSAEKGSPTPELHESFRVLVDLVPPQQTFDKVIDSPGGAMGMRPAVQMGFTDVRDHH